MLPFLQPKKIASTIVHNYADSKQTPEHIPDEHVERAHKIIAAVHAKDAHELAKHLQEMKHAPNEKSE